MIAMAAKRVNSQKCGERASAGSFDLRAGGGIGSLKRRHVRVSGAVLIENFV